jgi:Glycosyltransferase sugar-binding region containing DXD motif
MAVVGAKSRWIIKCWSPRILAVAAGALIYHVVLQFFLLSCRPAPQIVHLEDIPTPLTTKIVPLGQPKAANKTSFRDLLEQELWQLPVLSEITEEKSPLQCPEGLLYIGNLLSPVSSPRVDDPHVDFGLLPPRIIHQTSRTRCVSKPFAAAISHWQAYASASPARSTDQWAYYLHDDQAIARLLLPENAMLRQTATRTAISNLHRAFPHLEMVARSCIVHGTLRSDLWRYIVLWIFGGVYIDLDTAPPGTDRGADYLAMSQKNTDHSESILDRFIQSALPTPDTADTMPHTRVDAWFVVEQYHLLSQYFMVTRPQHPIMWYAIHDCLYNILSATDTGTISAAHATGPHALHHAFQRFRRDAGGIVEPALAGRRPVSAGRYVGTGNWTVGVVGSAANQNEYIQRDSVGTRDKKKSYLEMGMRHFQDDTRHPTGVSCLRAIQRDEALEPHYAPVSSAFV